MTQSEEQDRRRYEAWQAQVRLAELRVDQATKALVDLRDNPPPRRREEWIDAVDLRPGDVLLPHRKSPLDAPDLVKRVILNGIEVAAHTESRSRYFDPKNRVLVASPRQPLPGRSVAPPVTIHNGDHTSNDPALHAEVTWSGPISNYLHDRRVARMTMTDVEADRIADLAGFAAEDDAREAELDRRTARLEEGF